MFTERTHVLSHTAFAAVREVARTGAFLDIKSEDDGGTYPHICVDVPELVRVELEAYLGRPPRSLFLRRSPKGVHVPQIHHTDNVMGERTLILYIESQVGSGTAFVRHKALGVAYAPELPAVVDMLRADENRTAAWVAYAFCVAEPNKGCFFDAAWFHRAEPHGGYGEGERARCVLTAFY